MAKMLLSSLLFLVLGSLNYVVCNENFVTLDIVNPNKDQFVVQKSEFDNVYYEHFTPVKQYFVMNVNESNNRIWESDGYCTCVYSLLSKSENIPYLLYLVIDYGFTTKHLYYKRRSNDWTPLDIHDYSNSVTELKRSVKVKSHFSINISSTLSNEHYSVQYFSKDKPYRYFTPNLGFHANNVYHDNKILWSSSSNDERCVAVWAYVRTGSYYMLRLLVTNSFERSQIRTYYMNKNQWFHLHTLDENYRDDQYVQRPDNFLYPNYPFTAKQLESLVVVNEKTKEVFKEAYFDLSGDYYKYQVQDDDNYDSPEFKNRLTPLDLSPSSLNLLFTSYRCVDNVEYKTYSPTKNTVVTKVVDGKDIVWESRSNLERCVYALAPQKDGNAVSLYLLLNVNGELRQAFMENVNGKWVRSSLYAYDKKLSLLKETVSDTEMKMDLFNKFHNNEYSVEYNSGSKAYYLFLPNLGYACRKVSCKTTTVWQSGDNFDKCVAAWSYESFENVYYVKLLVVSPNGNSEFLTYINLRNRWELLDSYNKTVFNKSKYFNPGDFYHPQYPFNGFVPNYEFEDSKDTAEPESTETKVVKTPMYFSHFQYPQVSKPVLEKECLRVDISKPNSEDYEVGEAVFDGKLNLVTYLPPSGKYFDLVYDENMLIYLGSYQTHLCKFVNVYTKDKEFYLAEVLLRVKNEDVTVYFKKQGSSWHYINRESFLGSLDSLK